MSSLTTLPAVTITRYPSRRVHITVVLIADDWDDSPLLMGWPTCSGCGQP